MKTWEVIKKIVENPEKKFYDKNEPEAGNIYSDGVGVRWEDTAEPVKLTCVHDKDWEEAIEGLERRIYTIADLMCMLKKIDEWTEVMVEDEQGNTFITGFEMEGNKLIIKLLS